MLLSKGIECKKFYLYVLLIGLDFGVLVFIKVDL